MLALALKYRNYVIPAILVIVAAGAILWQRADISRLNAKVTVQQATIERVLTERDLAIDVAKANSEMAKRVQRERENTVILLEAERAKASARNESLQKIYKEISNAPKASCPAGPRLAAAHRGLLDLIGKNAD